jgi:hypothetical protein
VGKDCEHISGLEVESIHSRALMESAFVCLVQVNGLELAHSLSGFGQAGLTVSAITLVTPAVSKKHCAYAARRFGSSCAISAQITRAFLLATATHAFAVPSLRCFAAIHYLWKSTCS